MNVCLIAWRIQIKNLSLRRLSPKRLSRPIHCILVCHNDRQHRGSNKPELTSKGALQRHYGETKNAQHEAPHNLPPGS
jgi:hypothetical protein